MGTERSHVYLVNLDDGLIENVITRFTAGVNCLALNKDETRLLAGSRQVVFPIEWCFSDFTFKLVDLSGTKGAKREVVFKGHNGPVLSVEFDPLDTFAATSSCDGSVRIWRLSDASEVKSLRILAKFSDVECAISRCRLKWEPNNGEVSGKIKFHFIY